MALSKEVTGFTAPLPATAIIDEILLNLDSAPLPDEQSARIAIATALGRALTDHSIAKGIRYLDRMPTEMRVLAMRDAAARDLAITHKPEFIRFGVLCSKSNRKDENRIVLPSRASPSCCAQRAFGMEKGIALCRRPRFCSPPFGTTERKPLSPDSILEKSIRPALAKEGIAGKRIGWHSFRHSLATNLRSLGVDIKVAQELLRHSSCRTTLDIYTRAVDLQKCKSAKRAVKSWN